VLEAFGLREARTYTRSASIACSDGTMSSSSVSYRPSASAACVRALADSRISGGAGDHRW
jgi:hypothetical protein